MRISICGGSRSFGAFFSSPPSLLPGNGGGRGIDCALACPANNNGAAKRAARIIIMMVVTKNIGNAFDDKNRCQKFKHNRFVASDKGTGTFL
ncbi:MAG TPA: hypothetical protein VIP53_10650 [Nitrososphaera sp.]